jgi:release factor glutamine methyltransferase
MAATEVWTVGKLLTWTADFLRKHGSESPRLDAEVLLAHACQCQRIELYTQFDRELDEATRAAFRELVKQRSQGTPVAYLVGHKEFFSLDFDVDRRCLIPRPETEHLVIAALDWIKRRTAAHSDSIELRVVDIGTGSGCVAISLAKHSKLSKILAVDISPVAIEIAQANLAKHQLAERIQLYQGDLLEAIPSSEAKFDLIVSNPPYVSPTEFEQLPRDVRDYEPKSALVADQDGMAITQRLFEQAVTRLNKDGIIMVESSPTVIPRLEAWIDSQSLWQRSPTVKDLAGRPRIVLATLL